MALKIQFKQTVEAFAETAIGKISAGIVDITTDIYVKVAAVQSNKSRCVAAVSFGEIGVHKEYEFAPDMGGANLIKQAYDYLKTQPEFDGAKDC